MSLIKRDEWPPLRRSEEPVYSFGPPETAAPETHEGLMDYWRVLWRRKWTVASVAVVCGALGYLVARYTKPVYTAKTTIEVQDVIPSATSVSLTPADNQVYSAMSDIQTQVRILQSETLATRTIDKLEETGWKGVPGRPKGSVPAATQGAAPASTPAVPAPAASASSSSSSSAAPAEAVELDPEKRLLLLTADSLRVREAGPTRIIELVVDSNDRYLAAAYANTAANEFIDQNMEARWKMGQRTGEWLTRELDDMRAKLERSEYGLEAYAQKAGLLFANTGNSTDAKANVSGQKLFELQTALSTASTERVNKQSKYSIANSATPEGVPDIINDPALRDYQSKLSDLKRQIAELSAVYTPDFAKIKRLQGQVESVQAAFDRQKSAVVSKIKNEYDEALLREKLLTADFENQKNTVSSDAEKAVEYNLLKREVDTNRQLYEAMLQRVKESGVNAALKASNIRVVDAALVPLRPSRPSKRMNVAMGMFLGSLLGMGYVIVRDRSDGSFRAPGDAPRWLNVPELGVIPKGGVRLSMRGPANPLSLEASSSITAVLTSLMFSSPNGVAPRVIVFTSANPAEGKTTIASNIALKSSEIGKKVLLIDADFARPRLHEVFGLPNTHGFSDCMQASGLSEQELGARVHEVSPGLYVLPSGPPILDTSNLLFSGHVPEMLARLKRMFEMIVIDTPPTPQFAHARILGRMADGVVLIMRSGQTSRDAALATVQRLSDDRSHVLGTILNDWNPKTAQGNYYWQRGNRSYARWEPPIIPESFEARTDS